MSYSTCDVSKISSKCFGWIYHVNAVLCNGLFSFFQEFVISCAAKERSESHFVCFSLFSQTSVKKEFLLKAAEAHVHGFRRAMAGQGKIVIIST